MRLVKIMVISYFILIWGDIQAECLVFKPVFKLMNYRAILLKDVAANKYKNQQSVFDAAQELKILQQVYTYAEELSIENYSLMQYAQIQMDLSKQIEQYWLNLWQSNPLLAPKDGQYKNLKYIRQQIQILDKQIYPSLARSIKLNSCSNADIQGEFVANFRAIKGIPIAPDFSRLMVNAILSIKLKVKKNQ